MLQVFQRLRIAAEIFLGDPYIRMKISEVKRRSVFMYLRKRLPVIGQAFFILFHDVVDRPQRLI